MVDKTESDEAKRLGREAGRKGDGPDKCPFRGGAVYHLRADWMAGLNEGKAERKARATR